MCIIFKHTWDICKNWVIISEIEQVHTSEKDMGGVISLLGPLNKMMPFSCLDLGFFKWSNWADSSACLRELLYCFFNIILIHPYFQFCLISHGSRQILLSHCKNLSNPFHNIMSVFFSFLSLKTNDASFLSWLHPHLPKFAVETDGPFIKWCAFLCLLMFICSFDLWNKWNKSIIMQPLSHCPQPGSILSQPSPNLCHLFSTLSPEWPS